MKILVGCEFGGIVRDAFIKQGHDAVSCDLLPTERPGPHLQSDIFEAIHWIDWDMLIVFPPCTHLCASGARWWKGKQEEQKHALFFVNHLLNAPIEKIALENPVGKIGTAIRKSDQIIQPWQFGHGETKTTCLWLKNLPLLKPTNIVSGRESRIHKMSKSKERSKLRSITYTGIANAMAEQWG